MSMYENQIQEARIIIEEYFSSIGRGKRDAANMVATLKGKYSSEEALAGAGVPGLTGLHLPELFAKRIILAWMNLKRINVVVDASPEAEAARLTVEQLLAKYDPSLQPDAYGERLGKIARDYAKNMVQPPRVMVFDDHDKFNKDLTRKEFDRVKATATDRGSFNDGGQSYEVYPVGSRPPEYVDQSPWNPAESLYEKKSNAGVKWGDLLKETKQLIYIVTVKTPAYQYEQHAQDLKTLDTYRESELFNELLGAGAKSFEKAVEIFPFAGVCFKDLKRQGLLPYMRTPVGGDSSAVRPAPAGPQGGGP